MKACPECGSMHHDSDVSCECFYEFPQKVLRVASRYETDEEQRCFGRTPQEAEEAARIDTLPVRDRVRAITLTRAVQVDTIEGWGATAIEAIESVKSFMNRIPSEAFDISKPCVLEEPRTGLVQIEAPNKTAAIVEWARKVRLSILSIERAEPKKES